MNTITAVEAHKKVENEATTKVVRETRFIDKIEVGEVVRQGDIYIHRVKNTHKKGDLSRSRQLALGETQGSHHVAEAPSEVYVGTTLPPKVAERTFLGPLVESEERFEVSHPTHANVSLPAGFYQITHQMDARTLQRVRD